ncbi:MAG: RnfABCDGE type electron transport complex subunit B [Clostridiales bacterium]|nr:RnfABCDGE type electron transport complex subunit B [Clostridiales bacterium]
MNPILLAVIIVSAIGLIAGLGLAIASKVMAVPVDEKAEKIRECLPGANCGACGFSGCDGYAEALSKGETTNTALCNPGGKDAAKAIAEITGLAAGEVIPKTAVVLCQGNKHNAEDKLIYSGIKSCAMASQVFGGPKACIYGCVGFGDCVKACPFDAISLCDGIARINPAKCHSCGVCINTCPKGIIKMLPVTEVKAAVLCNNHEKGAVTRKQCKAGCIGCMKCVKTCEVGAVSINNFCAEVDYEKCIGCGQCHEACPVKSIDILDMTHFMEYRSE